MANILTKQILEEGPRNAIVKITGRLDTSNESSSPRISLSDFTSTGEPMRRFTGLRVDEINYSIGAQLSVELYWNATTPQMIMILQGYGKMRNLYGGGMLPNQAAAGFDGAINVITTGWASGIQDYTLLIRMVKLYQA